MGAVRFYVTARGKNKEEAFASAVHAAILDKGDDAYNGTISTTELVGDTVVIASKYSSNADSKGRKHAEKDGYGNKWESRCLDLGVCGYLVDTVKKHFPDKTEKPVYKTKYVLYLGGYGCHYKSADDGCIYDTMEKAEEAAVRCARETKFEVEIHKRLVPVSGNEAVEVISSSSVVVPEYPKDLPENSTVTELHVYAFYGFAAC